MEVLKIKLIISDRPLEIKTKGSDIKFVDLSGRKIANCTGCFGCWTKTPGKCVIRDDAVKIYPDIAKSSALIYISHIKYGGYDTIFKTMLERTIPIQQAFIRVFHGETHHIQREVVPKQAVVIAYGKIDDTEKEVFRELVSRNAYNMLFKTYRVIFTTEEQLEDTVIDEVKKWEVS